MTTMKNNNPEKFLLYFSILSVICLLFLFLLILSNCTISFQNTSNIGGTSTTDDTLTPENKTNIPITIPGITP